MVVKINRRYKKWCLIGASIATVVISAGVASAAITGDTGNIIRGVNRKIDGISPIVKKIGGSNIASAIEQISGFLDRADEFLDEIESYWDEISGFYRDAIGLDLDGIISDIDKITGILGISNPLAVRSTVMQQARMPNQVITAKAGANAVDRQVVEGVIAGVFSKRGQEIIADQQKTVLSSVDQSNTAARHALKRNVTQDVLKDIAVQQTTLAAIAGQSSAQLTAIQTHAAASNLMLDDISTTLDQVSVIGELDRQQTLNSKIAASQNLWIPGLDRYSNDE